MDSGFNRFARQALVFLATLSFLAVSTLALAHGHPDAKSADESHCAMCMAMHSTTHAVATPDITLIFTAVENPFLFFEEFPSFLRLAHAGSRTRPSLALIGPLPSQFRS